MKIYVELKIEALPAPSYGNTANTKAKLEAATKSWAQDRVGLNTRWNGAQLRCTGFKLRRAKH